VRAQHCGCQSSRVWTPSMPPLNLPPDDFSCWCVECILSVCVYVCCCQIERNAATKLLVRTSSINCRQRRHRQGQLSSSHDGSEWEGVDKIWYPHRWRSRRAVRYMKRYIAAWVKSISGIFDEHRHDCKQGSYVSSLRSKQTGSRRLIVATGQACWMCSLTIRLLRLMLIYHVAVFWT